MKKHLSLYQKYTIIIICVGLIPMTILSTLAIRGMVREQRRSITQNYEQSTKYMGEALTDVIESYDEISKMIYFYNDDAERQSNYVYGNYDNLKHILQESPKLKEEKLNQLMSLIQSTDSYIDSVHFVEYGTKQTFHYSTKATYFGSEELFKKVTVLSEKQKKSKELIIFPIHTNEYYNGEQEKVLTIARNYFDLSKTRINNEPLLGTLYIDIHISCLEKIYNDYFTNEENIVYIANKNEVIYSNENESIGENINILKNMKNKKEEYIFFQTTNQEYGITTILRLDSEQIFESLRKLQRIIYIVIGLSTVALGIGSILFSKRMNKPLEAMMVKMSEIETGNFKVRLPVQSLDEVGVLAERFNRMSEELEKYINQVYVAKMKQTEAELTSLRSQIYPHFLYNTLEVIRMTALEEDDEQVAEMIEALAAQIHYIVGNVKEMVPLKLEIGIVEKYLYLLNCRIRSHISMSVEMTGVSDFKVPKLILQPIVENAYLHGLKPKGRDGDIRIEVEKVETEIIIYVIDNGVGMTKETLSSIESFLAGNESGISNENNKQSIGIKNVHDRIRYIYGEEYGISISSTWGVGTIVSIKLPA